ncbi:hypothetical protein [Enterococcus wangshanyuanii]|uniref:Uncharacterized protein n=1 Tax=Enterococcus wangshanyuanii TaxID=2005703 RepID=A0ABQ1NW64_9ENTE|nr:hypothetical protein [Enterococcus wangshanyuanii]GGC85859.1 hypothetical protein GCM10011573_14380 [Enterococcus wangshanyuanii]
MNKRRVKSKLLVYFLHLAELGDLQAEAQAKELAKEIFYEEQQIKQTKEVLPDQLTLEED